MTAACLALGAGSASAGSSPFQGLQLNGNASLSTSGSLVLVTGLEQASSAYTSTPLTLSPTFSFTSTFSVLASKVKGVQGDGFAFVVQNDPAGAKALGYSGACLAVCNIQNYAAISFLSYVHNRAGLWFNGETSTQPFGIGFKTKEVIDVTVTYNQVNTTLAFTATNERTGKTLSGSYTVDLTTLGPSVYIGFTGGSGSAQSNEAVQSWSFSYTQ